jgi:hypothetical protein
MVFNIWQRILASARWAASLRAFIAGPNMTLYRETAVSTLALRL